MKLFNPIALFGHIRWSKGSKINQYLMAIFVTFQAMMVGMLLGWVSPSLPLLTAETGSPLGTPMSTHEMMWMTSGTFLVAIPTMLIGGYLADNFGRKATVLIGTLSLIICWLIKLLWVQSLPIILARAVSGIGNGIAYVIAPIYIKEISDDDIRGALCSFLILAQNLGFLFMYIIGDYLSFRQVLWVSFVLPVVHFIVFLYVPETPAYLVKKGKKEEAAEVIAWLRCLDPKDKRVLEGLDAIITENDHLECVKDKSAARTLLTEKAPRNAFLICFIILVVQETSGYLILLTYASKVFSHAQIGDSISPNTQTIVLGVVQLIGSITASCLIEKTGRKPLLIITSILCGTGMLILGVFFYLLAINTTLPGWVPIAAMGLSIFSVAAGFQPIPYVLVSEMFNFKLRGLVTSICIAMTAFMDFVQTSLYEICTQYLQIYGTFWMFSGFCFFGTIFTVIFIPETKNKSVEQIYKQDKEEKIYDVSI